MAFFGRFGQFFFQHGMPQAKKVARTAPMFRWGGTHLNSVRTLGDRISLHPPPQTGGGSDLPPFLISNPGSLPDACPESWEPWNQNNLNFKTASVWDCAALHAPHSLFHHPGWRRNTVQMFFCQMLGKELPHICSSRNACFFTLRPGKWPEMIFRPPIGPKMA